ncbi:hypothetical protein REPUB_Repub01dG0060900 [Reevesia pubescens]
MTRGARYSSGAGAAVFFLWIILIFSQLGLYFSAHEEASTSSTKSVRSPPRKARFFDTSASFHAPSSSAQFAGNEGDPDTVYGDDKRIVHTVNERALALAFSVMFSVALANGKENEKKEEKGKASVNALVLFLLLCFLSSVNAKIQLSFELNWCSYFHSSTLLSSATVVPAHNSPGFPSPPLSPPLLFLLFCHAIGDWRA